MGPSAPLAPFGPQDRRVCCQDLAAADRSPAWPNSKNSQQMRKTLLADHCQSYVGMSVCLNSYSN